MWPCPNCGKEFNPQDLANHYLFCMKGPAQKARMAKPEFHQLNAKEAEARASKLAKGAPLRFAAATKSAVFVLSNGQQLYLAEEWTFTYGASDRDWISITVNHEGPQVANPNISISAPADPNPSPWAKYEPITNWKIDSDAACLLVERQGGHLQTGGPFGGSGLFQLRMVNLDGHDVPLWWIPHRLQWQPAFVRADTGALAFIKDQTQFLFTQIPPQGLDLPQQNTTGLRNEVSRLKPSPTESKTVPRRAAPRMPTQPKPAMSSGPQLTTLEESRLTLRNFLPLIIALALVGLATWGWLRWSNDSASETGGTQDNRPAAPIKANDSETKAAENHNRSAERKSPETPPARVENDAVFQPIWSREIIEKQDKAEFAMAVTIYERPQFYQGPLPLRFTSGVRPFFNEGNRTVFSDFTGFRNSFVYQGPYSASGIAEGARTTDGSGTLLAEARFLRILTPNKKFQGIEIEEFHYDLGRLVFRCKSQINPVGYKVSESGMSGTKLREYFFIWPISP